MKEIAMLAKLIREELCDAEKYVRKAMEYKDKDPDLASVMYKLAGEELEHVDLEHEQVVRLISETGKEHPASMKAVWDWEHENMIEHTANIRGLMEMYKE